MRLKQVGNKSDLVATVVRNADTVSIPFGTPVCMVLNGTNDGLDVVLPSTAGAAKMAALQYGVVISASTPGQGVPVNGYGEAQVFGLCQSIIITRQTRSATTVSWNSETSIASYVAAIPETVGNGFATTVTGLAVTVDTAATTATVAVTIPNFLQPFAVLGQSLASYASSTSATSDTRTALTASVKAFLRMM